LEYAKAQSCVIVLKDGDFHQRSFCSARYRKSFGFVSAARRTTVLLGRADEINEFVRDETAALYIVDR
jgi:hypothetical protein